ncbi:hypothetical protein V8C42DRAFT_308806 [Trichoderma barbatum]
MSASRRDYPSSLYPEVGSSYRSSGYTNSNNSTSGYSSRRNSSSNHHHSHGDYPRSRDHGHLDRNERNPRDAHPTNTRTKSSQRGRSLDHHNRDRKNGGSSKRSSSLWERVLPPDFRPSQADPEARHHRLCKEKECEGFDWTPGVVLALMGAAALFSVERSLIKRQKKDYIQH